MSRLNTIPDFAIASLSNYSPTEIASALQFAIDNLSPAALAKYYEYAKYYRPAMRRELQLKIDHIGRLVQQGKQQMHQQNLSGVPATGMSSYGRFRVIPQRFPSEHWERATLDAFSEVSGLGEVDILGSIGNLVKGIGSGVQSAAAGIGTALTSQQNADLAKLKAQQDFELKKLAAQGGLKTVSATTAATAPKVGTTTPAKPNYTMYIALGGVVLVGGGVAAYFLTRKKK